MARSKVTSYADEKTPSSVKIQDKFDLVVWMFGQYGPWLFIGIAAWFFYQDNKEMQRNILEVTRAQITVNAQVVSGLADVKADFKVSLTEMNKQLAAIADEARTAHKTTPPSR